MNNITSKKLNDLNTIITHDGIFHADEIFAIAQVIVCMGPENDRHVKINLENDKNILVTWSGDAHRKLRIKRTRDIPTDIDNRVMLIDVGGVFDPNNWKFDHHQKSFEWVWHNGSQRNGSNLANKKLMASCGLLWTHLSKVVPDIVQKRVSSKFINEIIGIDARDNGEKCSEYNVSTCISSFNPVWNPGAKTTQETINERFVLALKWAIAFVELGSNIFSLMGEVIENEKAKAVSEVVASKILTEKINGVKEGDSVLVLEEYIPWSGTKEIKNSPDNLKFVVFPSITEGEWIAQTIRGYAGEDRATFPEEWVTEEGKEPAVKGLKFCHKGRFLCVFCGKDEALEALRLIQ